MQQNYFYTFEEFLLEKYEHLDESNENDKKNAATGYIMSASENIKKGFFSRVIDKLKSIPNKIVQHPGWSALIVSILVAVPTTLGIGFLMYRAKKTGNTKVKGLLQESCPIDIEHEIVIDDIKFLKEGHLFESTKDQVIQGATLDKIPRKELEKVCKNMSPTEAAAILNYVKTGIDKNNYYDSRNASKFRIIVESIIEFCGLFFIINLLGYLSVKVWDYFVQRGVKTKQMNVKPEKPENVDIEVE